MAEWNVSEVFEPADPKEMQIRAEGTKMIREIKEDDRPREKMMRSGADTLSTAELMAILIGSGTTKVSAVDLMQKLLDDCDGKLRTLSRMKLEQLLRYNGIGPAKALTILAACELGRRRLKEASEEKPQRMDNPTAIYEHIKYYIQDSDVEQAFCVYLNHRFAHIKTVRISNGGLTETAIDVRLVMREALLCNATVMVLVHNHPSGNTRPSRDDDNVTHRVADACKIMRIHMLDHLVVSDTEYYSYHENGKL